MVDEHKHHFKPLIRRDGPYGFEWVSGYEPCECGKTPGQVFMERSLDPFADARAAVAIARKRPFRPWRGTSYLKPR